MSAARARRRLMAHERYRRRALLLGPYRVMYGAHLRAFSRVARWIGPSWRTPWLIRDPRRLRP